MEQNDISEERPHCMVLRTEGLVKRYGKRTVVNDVSINVRQGEIVGLLGPNGAGKTTSFYMTTGLIVPNAGHIFLDQHDITDYPVYKRARAGIGYLPQEASVFRKLSVEDNIMSVLEMTKLSRKEQLEKLESLIADFNLGKVRRNKGDQLSGGERRRTEIARCLAINPKFIMLDEPFAGVDPIAVEEIQHVVWRLKYRNIGILITDHNVQETLTITDRAYLLFEGRILFQGKPEELAENRIVKEHKTVFIMQIGGKLRDGSRHDGRAPDYDDWALNGDILMWNPVLECAFEISSMGIRVDEESLARQLKLAGCEARAELPFHKMLLNGELPLTIGGGIGQSRLCMLMIGTCHIGEVQSSLWDETTRDACQKAGIMLL